YAVSYIPRALIPVPLFGDGIDTCLFPRLSLLQFPVQPVLDGIPAPLGILPWQFKGIDGIPIPVQGQKCFQLETLFVLKIPTSVCFTEMSQRKANKKSYALSIR